MSLPTPDRPKIYHIIHVDRLASVVAADGLWCDAEVDRRKPPGTTIGMNNIKQRRLRELTLTSHPDLHVGDCVPFYFCPRSIMLFLIDRRNAELQYAGGQQPIIHLEADLRQTVVWADAQPMRWAFTLSNAGSYFFEDRNDLAHLHEIDWTAVQARDWREHKDGKQAEFLLEHRFPWHLVDRIGVHSEAIAERVLTAISGAGCQPRVEARRNWYY